jgi:hypothetical protein
MPYHQYADDTQIYTSNTIPNTPPSELIAKSETCISEVKDWMSINKLKLNEEKTEVMLICSQRKAGMMQSSDFQMNLCNSRIDLVDKVKNLGTILDSSLSMDNQVNFVCQCLIIELKKISYIRSFLTIDMTKTLIVSLVFSRLDYCNSLLFGLPTEKIRKLQVIQNYAARLVFRKHKRENVTPLLKSLHWLTVKNRINFKAAVLIYRCLEGSAPTYLSELIKIYRQSRSLRSSSDKTKLVIPKRNSKYGERAFSFFGPKLWNSLPQNIREANSLLNFKKKLKTFYFKSQFD